MYQKQISWKLKNLHDLIHILQIDEWSEKAPEFTLFGLPNWWVFSELDICVVALLSFAIY